MCHIRAQMNVFSSKTLKFTCHGLNEITSHISLSPCAAQITADVITWSNGHQSQQQQEQQLYPSVSAGFYSNDVCSVMSLFLLVTFADLSFQQMAPNLGHPFDKGQTFYL